jgi:hypothetical protein
MKRRAFVGGGAAVVVAAATEAAGPAKATVIARNLTFEGVSHANRLTRRYRLALDRVRQGGPPHYTREFVLADAAARPHTRRFTEYSGDVSGRYLGALATAALDLGQDFPELRDLVSPLLALQKPQGFFGAEFAPSGVRKQDMAALWGNGRLLLGLLEYHRLLPSREVLEAATKMGDFLTRIGPEMNSDRVQKAFASGAFAMGYICWTQMVEALVELHRVNAKPEYLRLAREIAQRIEWRPDEHSHGFLCSVRGVVELFHSTREPRYLRQAEAHWEAVTGSGNVALPGTIPEAWLAPAQPGAAALRRVLASAGAGTAPRPVNYRTEGCSEADWLRLNLELWQLTRNPRYLQAAERTLFNEFALNQFSTGDFGHRVMTSTGVLVGGGREGVATARAWWCCTLHGLHAFAEIRKRAFRVAGDALVYDLPIESRAAHNGLEVEAGSTLEADGAVTLRVRKAPGRPCPIWIRDPEWAQGALITVNLSRVTIGSRDGYYALSRLWKPGDEVWVHYRLRTRVERQRDSGKVAIFHGPWLLGVDEHSSPFFFDEPIQGNVVKFGQAGRDVALQRAPFELKAPYGVPVARFQLPYLPGGYRMAPAVAVLRPLAEQTGMPTTAWEYLFQPDD